MHSYAGGGANKYAAAPGDHTDYVDTGYGGALGPAARNSWDRDYQHTGRLDADGVSPPTPATARFPAGNYQYDDGVYDARRA